jgi:hypothetical protein
MVTEKIRIDLCCKINRKQKDGSLEIETKNRSIQEADIELAIDPLAVEERMQAGGKLNSYLRSGSSVCGAPKIEKPFSGATRFRTPG